MRTINVRPRQRRLRCSRLLFFISGVLLCFFYSVMLRAKLSELSTQEGGGDGILQVKTREVIAPNMTQEVVKASGSTQSSVVIIVNRTDMEQCIYVEPQPPPTTTPPPRPPLRPPHRKGEYPEDIFSVEQRRQGWVVLHAFGMIYMFVALAIVCDEFFVPALEVITHKLDISDDVAGATFMASGGSAPELFTSLIGVFVSHSNVGIGTIIGSAVFNILFVIGMCAIFSREVLHLTWWPLFRDVSFYILDLVMLIVFFLDNMILWWESLILVLGYISYVCFMKFNSPIEQVVKTQLNKHMSIVQAWTTQEPDKESQPTTPPPRPAAIAVTNNEDKSKPQSEAPQSPAASKPPDRQEEKDRKLRVRPVLQRGGSSASLHNTSLRSTIFQLMIHTLDPLGEDDDRKPKSEQSSASGSNNATAKQSASQPSAEEIKSLDNNHDGSKSSGGSGDDDSGDDDSGDDDSGDDDSGDSSESEDDDGDKEDEENEPLSLDWPGTRRKQATYLFLLPIVFPLWLTLPDVRNPASKKYFALTFIGSVLWIAVFSYLMVWWAHQVGETMGISEEIMGLTILAAGTSIPDLITSVIVARKGLGDMAVSSSVGSNIFDITVGLPVPWLLYSLLHNGDAVIVSSNGLFCAIVLLFLMLLFVTISIATCRWKMSRTLGLTMFALYFVFLILSVLLEDRVLVCTVSI
ncbi:sodium/potassium/calcium exchanger 1-like isoform X2 [Dunckerocampus dactyliophorus]|uniref:sodium/potassium/calcium exchanger 1-like isoform X2 n=1 Tax=Dunckerocampus dactyliophorus TaxID=161453 RepID=UPI00240759F0|nr:sodium/potassium/calcium exchanger 1-like isoform X2 [Dunckerocampus dactyliophorus]